MSWKELIPCCCLAKQADLWRLYKDKTTLLVNVGACQILHKISTFQKYVTYSSLRKLIFYNNFLFIIVIFTMCFNLTRLFSLINQLDQYMISYYKYTRLLNERSLKHYSLINRLPPKHHYTAYTRNPQQQIHILTQQQYVCPIRTKPTTN